MRKEFLQLPVQAVMAELHNMEPLGKVSVNEISEKYTQSQYYSYYKFFFNFSKLLIELSRLFQCFPVFCSFISTSARKRQKISSFQTFLGGIEIELQNTGKYSN